MNRLQYITLVFILLCAFACKKKNNEEVLNTISTPVNFDFTYSGKQWAYQPITFTSTLDDTATVTWDFGDGEITHYVNKIHTYKADGEYTVKLTAYGKTVAKPVKIGVNLQDFLSKYSNWHRSSHFLYDPKDINNPNYISAEQEDKDVNFTLTYKLVPYPYTSALSSTYPYAVVFPGIDSTTKFVFPLTEIGFYNETDTTMVFSQHAQLYARLMDNKCTFRKDGKSASIEIHIQDNATGKAGVYNAYYISK